MSKIVKKRFMTSKEKGTKILEILNGKKASVDVLEFINTIKFVINVLEDYLKAKDKDRPQLHDDGARIEQLLNNYEDLLVQLVNTGRFLRFFTSNRVRKNLDQINSQLHKEVSLIFLGLQTNNRKSISKKPSGKGKSDFSKEKPSEVIRDEESRMMWETAFGQTLMVDWKEFIFALSKSIRITEHDEKQLKYILDNSNTGFVSMYKFADFLNGFGSLRTCIERTHSVLDAEWFHGFLSSAEAERLLERQPPGTFLIRFSKSKAGSFAIAYVDANQKNTVTHTLITCCPPSGFKIEEAYNRNARGRLFVSLHEVVDFYNYILKAPFRSDLSRQSWFHGDLTSQEAEEILNPSQEGFFLFRFSSKSGFLAVSYVNEGIIKHGLLECLPGGYKFDNQPTIYPTLEDLVTGMSDVFVTPVTSLTFEKRVDLSKMMSSISNDGQDIVMSDSQYTNFSSLVRKAPGSPGVRPKSQFQFTSQNSSEYGGMPNHQSSSQEYGGMRSSQEYGGMPSQEYGGMPSQEYGGMPSHQLGNSQEYGGMPSQEYGGMPSQEYGGMPSNSSEYGGMPETGNQYGKMPNQLLNPSQQSTTASPGQYGRMPNTISSTNLSATNVAPGQYGRVPNAINTSTSFPSTTQNETPATGQYGRMPNSNPSINTPPPSQQASQYGKITMPSATTSSQIPNTSSPDPNQYGRMPTSLPSTVSPPQSPTPATNQYGKMPGGSIPIPTNTPPVTSTAQGQYGKMPGAQFSTSPPNTQIDISAQQRASTNLGNYGAIPPRASQKFNQPVNPPSMPATSTSNTPGNYGSIPSPSISKINISSNLEKTTPAYGAIPSPTANRQSTPPNQQYGQMPTGGLTGQTPLKSVIKGAYGSFPPATNESDYGSLPADNEYQGLPNQSNEVEESDYGGIPPTL